jgi:hypothetical protein
VLCHLQFPRIPFAGNSEVKLRCTKNVGFRNTANSVPLMYVLMSFETDVQGIPLL